MVNLPIFPVIVIDILGSSLILLLGWASFNVTRRAKSKDPDNVLWLFLYWLSLAFFVFSLSRAFGQVLGNILVLSGFKKTWMQIQPYSGGLNSIISVTVASITLFFHNIQKLYYRKMRGLETTSQEILTLNQEIEALVMERTMAEMALGMADGIRNPLHIIGGFSRRLLKKAAPDDPARQWAETIAAEAKRLDQVVSRFETLTQRKEAFLAQENLNEIVQEVLEIIHLETQKKNIQVHRNLYSQPIYGRMNKHLLKVALVHLLHNAVEATPSAGAIEVQTSKEAQKAEIMILDTGRGMPPETLAKVFDPFYTTKIGGTGLGMAIVRQIIDEHRGAIDLESQVGRGTKVTIRLPLIFTDSVPYLGTLRPPGEAPLRSHPNLRI
jgi:signal transduction histidine kinase